MIQTEICPWENCGKPITVSCGERPCPECGQPIRVTPDTTATLSSLVQAILPSFLGRMRVKVG